jgi:hypothetical protein
MGVGVSCVCLAYASLGEFVRALGWCGGPWVLCAAGLSFRFPVRCVGVNGNGWHAIAILRYIGVQRHLVVDCGPYAAAWLVVVVVCLGSSWLGLCGCVGWCRVAAGVGVHWRASRFPRCMESSQVKSSQSKSVNRAKSRSDSDHALCLTCTKHPMQASYELLGCPESRARDPSSDRRSRRVEGPPRSTRRVSCSDRAGSFWHVVRGCHLHVALLRAILRTHN